MPFGRRLRMAACMISQEHVFQVGAADLQVLHLHAGLAQRGQQLFDLGGVVRLHLRDAAGDARLRRQRGRQARRRS
jgi:hypothetical protein